MRQNLLFTAAVFCLIAGSQAAYGATCGSGNTSTSGTFCNSGTLTIGNTNGPTDGSPYPFQIAVSSMSGAVSSISVTLNGFTHPFPIDVNLMLVSPDGSR